MQVSLLICFGHRHHLDSLCWPSSVLTMFTPDNIETAHIPNPGRNLSTTNLNHVFLKLHTPTYGKKETTLEFVSYITLLENQGIFLCICRREDHIFYQKQQSVIEVHCAFVKRSLDIWNSNYLHLFTTPYDILNREFFIMPLTMSVKDTV